MKRLLCLTGAAALVAAALFSPLAGLANGVLFSAHMAQHLLLLLLAPALLLLGLGPPSRGAVPPGAPRVVAENPARRGGRFAPLSWAAGIGSMWFWHVPQFCDAATSYPSIHWIQVASLLGLGAAFWWPILGPSPASRLEPGPAVAYLFTACLACTALGMLLTLTPIEVCPIFRSPLRTIRYLTHEEDRQIGGLLMWVPMCAVYIVAILFQLHRLMSGREPSPRPRGAIKETAPS